MLAYNAACAEDEDFHDDTLSASHHDVNAKRKVMGG
jgi:hypothetical protein